MHKLIVDIETIRGENYEQALHPFINHLAGKQKRGTGLFEGDKYATALGRCALSPVGARVLCIGVLELKEQPSEENWSLIIGQDEKVILLQFASFIKSDTEFITFNGRSFDFPFLLFRAAIHEISLNLDIYPYNKPGHIDLFVHLNEISGLSKLDSDLKYVSLKKWLQYFNLGDKESIKEGQIDLEKLYQSGDWNVIEDYCKNDVMATYEIYKKCASHFKSPYTTRNQSNAPY